MISVGFIDQVKLTQYFENNDRSLVPALSSALAPNLSLGLSVRCATHGHPLYPRHHLEAGLPSLTFSHLAAGGSSTSHYPASPTKCVVFTAA